MDLKHKPILQVRHSLVQHWRDHMARSALMCGTCRWTLPWQEGVRGPALGREAERGALMGSARLTSKFCRPEYSILCSPALDYFEVIP